VSLFPKTSHIAQRLILPCAVPRPLRCMSARGGSQDPSATPAARSLNSGGPTLLPFLRPRRCAGERIPAMSTASSCTLVPSVKRSLLRPQAKAVLVTAIPKWWPGCARYWIRANDRLLRPLTDRPTRPGIESQKAVSFPRVLRDGLLTSAVSSSWSNPVELVNGWRCFCDRSVSQS